MQGGTARNLGAVQGGTAGTVSLLQQRAAQQGARGEPAGILKGQVWRMEEGEWDEVGVERMVL